MPLTVDTADVFARDVGKAVTAEQNAMAVLHRIFGDSAGIAVRLVRGTTDENITAIVLKNENGTECYIYPNAAGDGPIVSDVAP